MSRNQTTLWDGERMGFDEALDLTAASLNAYGARYRHWCIAYSGGKDSTATVAAVTHLIAAGRVRAPESLTVLYADTRQELPPLHLAAMHMLDVLRAREIDARVVLPLLDKRYFVYILGRGVPPPNNNTLRWCTRQIKVEPMAAVLAELRERAGEKLLMLTGVRLGESAARDQRIALSCGKNDGECGQGWFQQTLPSHICDTLAPLLHWRVCFVWDFLVFGSKPKYQYYHGLPTGLVAEVYGGDEAAELNARTGCIGCPLAEKETALEYLIGKPEWAYLAPLLKLKPLYRELRKFERRLQKDGERNQDGKLSKNPNRKGPLTLETRRWALDTVLSIQETVNAGALAQGQPRVDLINAEEEARICELIARNTWPNGWDGTEPRGDVLLRQVRGEGIAQELLLSLEEVI